MSTVLLGEAPKRRDGFAFDAGSWTTQQLAHVLEIDEHDLNKVFFVMNVFKFPQRTGERGFDAFSSRRAVDEIDAIHFPSQRIICVGGRVSNAMEAELDLPPGAIPQNAFGRFNGTARGSGWELARIPHPSGLWNQGDRDGLVLPLETRTFLKRAAGASLHR